MAFNLVVLEKATPTGQPENPSPSLRKKALSALVFATVFAYVFIALFVRSMLAELDHDENQFVASGKLLASAGDLPYRDFPYFHLPLLVWIDAGLFHFTDHLLLAARTFSVVCAWLSLLVVFGLAWRSPAEGAWSRRWSMAAGVAALLFVNQLFTSTYFRAWNNILPPLLTLGALVCQWAAANRQARSLFFLSGVILALAAGTRLTAAPLVLPFLIMAWFVPGTSLRQRMQFVLFHGLGFAAGLLLVLAPVLGSLPAITFDNFVYNGPINMAYRGGTSSQFLPALAGKVEFLVTLLAHPANLSFVVAVVWLGVVPACRREELRYPRRLILLLLAFSFIGALAPTPSFRHYYYPFAVLGTAAVALGLTEYQADPRRFNRAMIVLWAAVLISAFPAGPQYAQVFAVFKKEQWATWQIHQDGLALAAYVPSGHILTVAPIIPLEGGYSIYEPFTTGPFAWRAAYLLSPAQRAKYGFVSEIELPQMLDRTPPEGILVGYDTKYETALVDYARSHGYRAIALPDDHLLYVRPAPGP